MSNLGGWLGYEEDLMSELATVLGDDNAMGHNTTQRALPKLKAFDPTTILTKFSPAVVKAITRVNATYGAADGIGAMWDQNKVCLASFVNQDGSVTDHVIEWPGIADKATATVAEYVAGGVHDDDPPWVRFKGTDPDVVSALATFEVCSNLASSDIGQIGLARDLMGAWQDAVQSAADAMISTAGDNVTLKADVVETFHQRLASLAAKLDALNENPPRQFNLDESWSHAVDKTEGVLKTAAKDAGKAVAEVGNLAGQAAGAAASGFFNQATLLTLAVAGIAVFVLLR